MHAAGVFRVCLGLSTDALARSRDGETLDSGPAVGARASDPIHRTELFDSAVSGQRAVALHLLAPALLWLLAWQQWQPAPGPGF